jgi:hypothetical protein
MNLLRLGVALLALGGLGSAQAAVGYCNNYLAPGGTIQTDGLAVTDMTYSGNTPTANADNCYGVSSGNDSLAAINALWGGGFVLLTKSDGPDGSILNGIDFTVTNSNVTGTWLLTGSGTPLPQFFDFVGVIKQGAGPADGGFAAYLFDDASFDGSDGGTYEVTFGPGNNDGTPFDLSHISIYGRLGSDPCIGSTDPNCGGGGDELPEPASLVLVGIGLLGAALTRRRRSQAL